jgi:hypothetical protein
VNTPVITTAFLMTVLTFIGLLFFIRASVKDRTKQIKLIPSEPEASVLSKLQKYFEERAYQIVNVDAPGQRIIFQGFVRPSWFLTILLTALAGFGLSCIALVLSSLYPNLSHLTWLLLALAPVAGIFYWRNAGRCEKVLLAVEAEVNGGNSIVVTAHRDELIQLQKTLSLPIRE